MDLKQSWFQTYTGLQFYPFDPKPEQICLEDIAHHLSLQCRFNGACKRFYSVAQHSVLVSSLVEDRDAKKWGLLHDAAEAYIGDMARPVKIGFPDFKTLEAEIQVAVAQRFGLLVMMPDEVKDADEIALHLERRSLMGGKITWTGQDAVQFEIEQLPDVYPMSAQGAEASFLQTAKQLGIK